MFTCRLECSLHLQHPACHHQLVTTRSASVLTTPSAATASLTGLDLILDFSRHLIASILELLSMHGLDCTITRIQGSRAQFAHSLYPRRGTVWRVGDTRFNDRADGRGVEWSPVPAALPAFLSAWTGQLGDGVRTPQQSPWFSKDDIKTGDNMLARTILS